jgi:hypothetical protein
MMVKWKRENGPPKELENWGEGRDDANSLKQREVDENRLSAFDRTQRQ